MKPPKFEYESPRTVDEALDVLASRQDGAAVLAGGQSLVPLLNMRLARPDVVVDVNGVKALDRIHVNDSTVTLGAMTRLAAVERDTAVLEALPVLVEAAHYVAHPQIRNRTTIGGTLCHADPNAEMPTVAVALGATFELMSRAGGARSVAAGDFFQSVFLTTKRPDELLVAAKYPRYAGHRLLFGEIARRHGDFPFVGLCLVLKLEEGVLTSARVAAAGVMDRPVRLNGMEAALIGAELNAATIDEAADAAASEVAPPTDAHGTADFRRGLLRTLVRRLLREVEESGT